MLESDVILRVDHAIRDAYVALDAAERQALAKATPELSSALYHALIVLAKQPGQSLGELADHLFCDKGNASGLIQRLTNFGLVDSKRHTADKRRLVLRLTPAGCDVLHRAAQAHAAILQQALAPLDVAKIAAATDDLQALAALFYAVQGKQTAAGDDQRPNKARSGEGVRNAQPES